ncbi:hypothetical protein D3C81_1678600 [compost metagenome]
MVLPKPAAARMRISFAVPAFSICSSSRARARWLLAAFGVAYLVEILRSAPTSAACCLLAFEASVLMEAPLDEGVRLSQEVGMKDGLHFGHSSASNETGLPTALIWYPAYSATPERREGGPE